MIKRSSLEKWFKAKEQLPHEGPHEGVLCVVFMPIGENNFTGEVMGLIALAYFRSTGGWIYADIPRSLQWEPYYWYPFDDLNNSNS